MFASASLKLDDKKGTCQVVDYSRFYCILKVKTLSMSGSPTSDPKDISMVDVSHALTEASNNNEVQSSPPLRRKSTLILTDEDQMKVDEQFENNDKMHLDHSQSNLQNYNDSLAQKAQQSQQQQPPQQQQQQQQQQNYQQSHDDNNSQAPPAPDLNITVPIEIRWNQGGEKVYVTGSFTGWRKMIGLARQPDNSFLITLGLPVGTHRFRFVIDNELRFSDFLPTATDQMGNFVNYVEVTPENVRDFLDQQEDHESEISDEGKDEDTKEPAAPLRKSSISRSGRSDSMWGLTQDDDDMGGGYSRYHDGDGDEAKKNNYQFINDIPPIFVDPKVMEQYYMAIEKQSKSPNGQQAWLHPPHLPPHLENVILNNFNSRDRDNNSGALPIPNHVVLNHLATTSIKHNTLSVASVVRYKRKYVTQVLYAPLHQ